MAAATDEMCDDRLMSITTSDVTPAVSCRILSAVFSFDVKSLFKSIHCHMYSSRYCGSDVTAVT